eukprot:m.97910 g.97910  ORF g.97910 m.97910 type:complete len:55 (+) comp36967_c0_seq2:203-367(+)
MRTKSYPPDHMIRRCGSDYMATGCEFPIGFFDRICQVKRKPWQLVSSVVTPDWI